MGTWTKASVSGGIVLGSTTRAPRVVLQWVPLQQQAPVIKVIIRGSGSFPQEAPSIFIPFQLSVESLARTAHPCHLSTLPSTNYRSKVYGVHYYTI